MSRSERNYEEVDRKLMGLFFSIKGNIKELENKKQIFQDFLSFLAWFCLRILKISDSETNGEE